MKQGKRFKVGGIRCMASIYSYRDSIETRRRIITSYPELKKINKEVQSMIRSPELLLRLFKRAAQDDTRYSELMQGKRESKQEGKQEGKLELLLEQIRDGDLKDEDVILKNARKLGYSLEDINKMLSDNPNETYDED